MMLPPSPVQAFIEKGHEDSLKQVGCAALPISYWALTRIDSSLTPSFRLFFIFHYEILSAQSLCTVI